MIQAVRSAFALPDLRKKILYTFLILGIYRLFSHVPVPGVNSAALEDLFQSNQLLGLLDLLSGGAMANFSIMAMGVYPYITATIILQLLTPIIPALQNLQKEGEQGRNKLNRYGWYMTVPLALLQAYGQAVLNMGGGGNSDVGAPVYSMGDGIVTWAYDVRAGWGNVVIIRHAYRDPANGRVRYWVQLICEGKPYQKPEHMVGAGRVGIDPGPRNFGLAGKEWGALVDLAAPLKPERSAARRLQRRIDRQRRANNPGDYLPDGRLASPNNLAFIDGKTDALQGVNRAVVIFELNGVPVLFGDSLRFLRLVSFFMDISSEMIYPLVPIFLASVLGVNKSLIGLIEGLAEASASLLTVYAGWFSDRVRQGLVNVRSGWFADLRQKSTIRRRHSGR